MKLITYEEFCKMPAGTIFAPFEPCVLREELSIKVDGGDKDGWFNGVMSLEPWNLEDLRVVGEQSPARFEVYDGANADYQNEEMILVLEEADIDRMIMFLKWAKNGCDLDPDLINDFVKSCTGDRTDEKQGEWVVCGDGERVPFMCTHCGKTTSWYHKQTAKYCPNCGAKMKGEE